MFSYLLNRRAVCRPSLVLSLYLLLLPVWAQETNLEDLRQRAEQGEVNAQAELGHHYHTGQIVRRDYEQAVAWYRKAAEQGQPKAQYNLGLTYAFGEGVERDPAQAAEWYRRAAGQGHPAAAFSLGLAFLYGEGVTRDAEQAAKWLRQAAENNYIRAQVRLAQLYNTGSGIPQDYEQAAYWYREAAERGDAFAQYHLGNLYRDGHGVSKDNDWALQWYQRAAKQNHPAAAAELKKLQKATATGPGNQQTGRSNTAEKTADAESGSEPQKTPTTAISPADQQPRLSSENDAATGSVLPDSDSADPAASQPPEQATAEQSADGDSLLGRLFNSIKSIVTDPAPSDPLSDPAVQTAQKALEAGDSARAIELLQTEALNGNPAAETRLGQLHFEGQAVPQSRDHALLWYRRAAKRDYAPAQFNLGNMYLLGEGVLQDDTKALAWFNRAAEQGHEAARQNAKSLEQRVAEKQRYRPRGKTQQTEESSANTELESAVETTNEAVEASDSQRAVKLKPGRVISPPIEPLPEVKPAPEEKESDDTDADTGSTGTAETEPVSMLLRQPHSV